MATVIIRPNSDVSISANATRSSGTNDYYTYIDEAELDTGDYIGAPANGVFQGKFGWTSSGLVSVDSINSLTLCADHTSISTQITNGYLSEDDNISQFTYYTGEHPNAKVVMTTNPDTGNAWSLSEIESLVGGMQAGSSDKFALKLYQLYIVVDYTAASSGQSLTLTCAAGSYTQTGTAATLTYTPAAQNLTLSCGAGSYTITGTNADITSSRTLICEPASGGAYPDIIVSGAGTSDANGTYVYGGMYQDKPYYLYSGHIIFRTTWEEDELCEWLVAIGDFYSYSSLYSSGEVSYIGVDTPDLVTTWQKVGAGSLPVPTVTAAPSLGYVLTGSDVTLTYTQGAQSYTLTCDAGSYTITGTNADLTVTRHYTLSCEAGSYTITGTDATFEVKRNYVLTCGAGSYILTGTDINFGNTKAYSLTCEAGAYTLTGSSVSFAIQRNYTLDCETGAYTLTGTDADLVLLRNYILACGTGSYALTGTNTGLTSARTMALESGSYALTGTNADFYRALVMACNSGSYTLTGTDASLTSHRIFALGMGSYVLVGTNAGLYILSPTPACRTATIEYENRTFAIPHENRTATIEYENRTLEVKCH